MIPQSHGSPIWLEGRWAEQKHATATRIASAISSLRQAGDKITYGSICRSVQSLYGISISANTIKRNDAAYEIYSASRSSRHYSPSKEQVLQKLLQDATGTQRNRLGAKIARLRSMRKDALIAMLLQLQGDSDRQRTTETNLRDEILRLIANKIDDRRLQQGIEKAGEDA
jgi:hypothetical protein